MKRLTRLTAMVLMAIALLTPSVAQAASSTCQAYNPQLCGLKTSTPSAGALPFTGLDLILLVGGGGALVAAGLVIRRLSQRLG